MFHFRKWPRWQKSGSRLEQVARVILLSAILSLVIWGFSVNNQRHLDNIAARDSAIKKQTTALLQDETNLLSAKQAQGLNAFLQDFLQRHGTEIRVYISRDLISGPMPPAGSPEGNRMLLYLCPSADYVSVQPSPLFAKALGQELLEDLRTRHFAPYFAQSRWPDGLAAALAKISTHFE